MADDWVSVGSPQEADDWSPLGEHRGALSNAPDDTTGTSMAKGAATAAIKGVGHIPGTAGDLRNLTDYAVQRAHSWLSGIPMEELQQHRAALEGKKAQLEKDNPWMGVIQPPPTGEYFSDPILAKTGEYHPTTGTGRAAMAAVEGGTSMLGPGAVTSMGRGVTGLLSGAAKAVPAGMVGGAAGDVATQFTGDPLAGIVAGSVVPAAGAKALSPAGKYIAPMVPGKREGLAAERLAAASSNPEKALADLKFQRRQIVEGSEPTTGMASGDIGLMKAQKRAANKDEELAGELVNRETGENSARIREIEKMAPAADLMDGVRLYQERHAQIDNEMQGWLTDAEAKARAAHETIPGSVAPEVSGAQLRSTVKQNVERLRDERAALYKAVDPEGKLSVVTSDARARAEALKASFDPDVNLPNELSGPVIDMVAKLGDVTSFVKLMDLDTTITTQMAKARRAGEDTQANHLRELKSAVMGDINNAVENQAKFQQAAVARGELAPENSIGYRLTQALERQRSDFYGLGADSRAGIGANVAGGPSDVPTGRGTQGSAGSQPGNAPGGGGVQGDVPNFDPEAAGRLAAAKAAHAEYAQTKGSVKSILKDEGYAGQYRLPASGVMAKAFPGGDNGYTATQTHLRAANNSPEAIGAVENMAIYRLNQAMEKTGELTQPALDGWKRKYGTSLRALDEVSPGFSQRFDNVAAATNELATVRQARTEAIKQAQDGVASKLLGLTDPSEVTRAIGTMLTAKDGPTQIKQLMTDASAGSTLGPRAIDAYRRAGVDYILGKTSNASVQGAEATLSSAKLRGMLDNNEAALTALYGKDGIANMHRVAADMERSEAAFNAIRAKGGPDTAQQLAPILHGVQHGMQHLLGRSALTAGSIGYGLAVLHAYQQYGALAATASLVAIPVYHAMSGMMQKLHANGIANVEQLYHAGLRDPKIGEALLSKAIDAKGEMNKVTMDRLIKAVARSNAMLDTYREDARIGRKDGGRIIDHGSRANGLIRAAERAKRAHGGSTEQLLALPDEHIARSLAIANQAMRQ